jgi:hypothetical protein
MQPALSLGTLLGLVCLPGCVTRPRIAGPLPVRNQHPAQLAVMHLDPADATVLAAGKTAWRTDLAYTSLWLNGSNNQGSWFMDGEWLRAALDARVGLGHGLQLGVQLAAAHTSGGFLDDFIIDYHDVFGFPDQDRSARARDGFEIEAARGGNSVWSVDESSAELLDVPIHLTWQLQESGERQVGLALRGGLELPVGDQERGYGNGQVDFAIGALLDYQAYGMGFTGHVQHTFAGTPRPARTANFGFQDVSSIGFGVELPLTENLNALVQAEWETSTLRDLGPRATAREQMLLWVGGRYQASRDWSVEIGFGEDLIGRVSPDFTAWFGLRWQPGS